MPALGIPSMRAGDRSDGDRCYALPRRYAVSGHHGHHHEKTSWRTFAVGVALNVAIVVVEIVYGVLSHSMALVADAGHNLGDVFGVGLGGLAVYVSTRRPSPRRTYGMRSSSILAALANGTLLLVATGAIAWEAVRRLMDTAAAPAVDGRTVMLVAGFGVVVNGASALLFLRGRHSDLNVRSAFLHLAGDAAVSIGVLASGAVTVFTHGSWLDPAVSLVLSLVIFLQAWPLLRQAANLALQAVPESIDPVAVRAFLAGLPGVAEVHDLHIWAMSTTEAALTAHLMMDAPAHDDAFFRHVDEELHERFGIEHVTLQVEECGAANPCRLAPEDVV
jgi:cobalt-zinc-cadmium efflux system protein